MPAVKDHSAHMAAEMSQRDNEILHEAPQKTELARLYNQSLERSDVGFAEESAIQKNMDLRQL